MANHPPPIFACHSYWNSWLARLPQGQAAALIVNRLLPMAPQHFCLFAWHAMSRSKNILKVDCLKFDCLKFDCLKMACLTLQFQTNTRNLPPPRMALCHSPTNHIPILPAAFAAGVVCNPPSIRPVTAPCEKRKKWSNATISSIIPSIEFGSKAPTPTPTYHTAAHALRQHDHT